MSVRDRLESETKYVEEQMAKIAVEHEALAEKCVGLHTSRATRRVQRACMPAC